MSQFTRESYEIMIAELLPQATAEDVEFVYYYLRAGQKRRETEGKQ